MPLNEVPKAGQTPSQEAAPPQSSRVDGGLRRNPFDKPVGFTEERLALHQEFFRRIIDRFGLTKVPDADLIAVLHIFPDIHPLVGALQQIADVQAIVPKPRSIDPEVLQSLEEAPIKHLSRRDIGSITESIRNGRKTVFMDIGGWFSGIVPQLMEVTGENFRGIVEDTENGMQKYEDVLRTGIDFPFLSAARSPLKEDEDRIVGSNIADATELVLTGHETSIQGMQVGVIGYGKIGRSFASSMQEKGGSVAVTDLYDDRVQSAESSGFATTDKATILRASDLICVANGNRSIAGNEFSQVKNGSWIVSVTSADDALDKSWLHQHYQKEQLSDYVTRYSNGDHYFYLVADGEAINLVLKKPVGDRILLVHGELLVSAYRLLTQQVELGNHEIDIETRREIRNIWNSLFE